MHAINTLTKGRLFVMLSDASCESPVVVRMNKGSLRDGTWKGDEILFPRLPKREWEPGGLTRVERQFNRGL